MPPIVSRYRHGTQVYDPPCLTTGANMYAFVVKADNARMQASVDQFLNVPARGTVHFTALGDSVLFFYLVATSLRSNDPSYPSGFVPDYETAASMPLLMRYTDAAGNPQAKFVNWTPYVLINNAMGCIAGREIYGFLKGLGQFTVPHLGGPLNLWDVKGEVFSPLTPSTKVEWASLYTVNRTSNHDHPIEDLLDVAEDAVAFVASLIKNWTPGLLLEIGIDVLKDVLARTFPVVNLRQLPDVENAQNASFQEICTAPMQLTALRRFGRLKGTFDITVPSYASHDVAGDLGLPGTGPTYPVELGVFLDMDFTVPTGTTIWRASVPSFP